MQPLEVENSSSTPVLRKAASGNQEKLPLSKGQDHKNHGTINANVQKDTSWSSSCNKSDVDIPAKSVDSDEREPMSMKRKFMFVMSFNTWILYFAMLLWIIPCRNKDCFQMKEWSFNLENVDSITNMEIIDDEVFGDLVLIGYSNSSKYAVDNEAKGTVAAYHTHNGTLMWQRNLTFVPKTLRCFHHTLNLNESSGSCVAMSRTEVALFYPLHGFLSWQREFSEEEFTLLDQPVMISCQPNFSRLIYSRKSGADALIDVLELSTGNRILAILTPCSDALYVKILAIGSGNETEVILICRSGGITGMWLMPKETLCDTNANNELFSNCIFAYVFRFNDRTMVQRNLIVLEPTKKVDVIALGWSNTVTLISKESKPFLEIWRKTFNDSLVRSMVSGHFTSAAAEIAVAVDTENSFVMVHIIPLSNGQNVASAIIDVGKVKSLRLLCENQVENSIDSLLLETETENHISEWMEEVNTSIPTNISFFKIKFGDKPTTITKISSTMSMHSGAVFSTLTKNSVFILAEEKANQTINISGQFIGGQSEQKPCNS